MRRGSELSGCVRKLMSKSFCQIQGDKDVCPSTGGAVEKDSASARSEEHTSELQSQSNLVCRLLLEKKNNNRLTSTMITYTSFHHIFKSSIKYICPVLHDCSVLNCMYVFITTAIVSLTLRADFDTYV